jgi:predicted nuclease of predicted toxin-antitoxin system
MKFLVDAGVGKNAEQLLEDFGFDSKAIRDIDPRMSDFEILQLAVAETRIIVTMDKDFGELVYNSGYNHSGILLLRLENMNGNEKAGILRFIIENYASELKGNFCVFQKGKFRVRHK